MYGSQPTGQAAEAARSEALLTREEAFVLVASLVTYVTGAILWMLGNDYGKVLFAIGGIATVLEIVYTWISLSHLRQRVVLPKERIEHAQAILKLKTADEMRDYAKANRMDVLIVTPDMWIEVRNGQLGEYLKGRIDTEFQSLIDNQKPYGKTGLMFSGDRQIIVFEGP